MGVNQVTEGRDDQSQGNTTKGPVRKEGSQERTVKEAKRRQPQVQRLLRQILEFAREQLAVGGSAHLQYKM